MKPAYYLRRRPCKAVCTSGRTCALDHDPQHPHAQHVCDEPLCACHSAAAYGLERVMVSGKAQYRRVNTMEVGE